LIDFSLPSLCDCALPLQLIGGGTVLIVSLSSAQLFDDEYMKDTIENQT